MATRSNSIKLIIFAFFFSFALVAKDNAPIKKNLNVTEGLEKKDKKTKKPNKFSLKTYGRFSFHFFEHIEKQNLAGFAIQSVRLGLKGDLAGKQVRYHVSFDPIDGDNEKAYLKNAFLQLMFFKDHSLRLGQFKIPYGRERSFNLEERAFLYHSKVSREFTPGRGVGVLYSARRLLSIFEIKGGIFNGDGSFEALEPLINLENKIDIFTQIGLRQKWSQPLRTLFHYSLYAKKENNSQAKINQSLSFELRHKRSKKQQLRWLSEVFVKTFFNTLESNSDGFSSEVLFGGVSLLSLRLANWQYALSGEILNHLFGKSEGRFYDSIIAKVGLSTYFYKDHLAVKTTYHFALNAFNQNAFSQSIFAGLVFFY